MAINQLNKYVWLVETIHRARKQIQSSETRRKRRQIHFFVFTAFSLWMIHQNPTFLFGVLPSSLSLSQYPTRDFSIFAGLPCKMDWMV